MTYLRPRRGAATFIGMIAGESAILLTAWHPAPNRSTRVEHEYFRDGAWVYLAAWDVHRAKVFGRCEFENGIAPVDRLVSEVMSQEAYKSARRVFWITDNCSAHRGQRGKLHVQHHDC